VASKTASSPGKKGAKKKKMKSGPELAALFEQTGILSSEEYQHHDIEQLDFDLNDPRFSVENLFGDMKGGALLDEMYLWWGDGEYDIAWYGTQDPDDRDIDGIKGLIRPLRAI
jgi:hypothetical protein